MASWVSISPQNTRTQVSTDSKLKVILNAVHNAGTQYRIITKPNTQISAQGELSRALKRIKRQACDKPLPTLHRRNVKQAVYIN
jgi:hypothetical protein